jgi:hypothetical protein
MSVTPWPPLLLGREIPWWVGARDIVLSLGAWALLGFWMRPGLLLSYDWLSAPMFKLTTQPEPDWPHIWRVLAPFVALSALLAAWLLYWGMRRRAILARQRDRAQPEALGVGEHAAFFGLTVEDVSRMRGAQVVTIRFDAEGRIVGSDPRL